MRPTISAIDHLVLTVADLQVTLSFYQNVMGMTAEKFTPSDGSTRWALKFGAQKINLHQAGAEFEPHAACPRSGSADLCFLSEIPLQDWIQYLDDIGVLVEDGPVGRTGATGPILSIYIRDPDGNLIEISNAA